MGGHEDRAYAPCHPGGVTGELHGRQNSCHLPIIIIKQENNEWRIVKD